jgi:hypothetical protein
MIILMNPLLLLSGGSFRQQRSSTNYFDRLKSNITKKIMNSSFWLGYFLSTVESLPVSVFLASAEMYLKKGDSPRDCVVDTKTVLPPRRPRFKNTFPIMYVNKSYEATTGYSLATICGKSFDFNFLDARDERTKRNPNINASIASLIQPYRLSSFTEGLTNKMNVSGVFVIDCLCVTLD